MNSGNINRSTKRSMFYDMENRNPFSSTAISGSSVKRYKSSSYYKEHEVALETSQSLMETLGLSQTIDAPTQFDSPPDGEHYCLLTLHPNVKSNLSNRILRLLTEDGLDKITLSRSNRRIQISRDRFARIFQSDASMLQATSRLSRNHCVIEYVPSIDSTYVYDHSMNGIRVGTIVPGDFVGKGSKRSLVDGDTLTLLWTKAGALQLAYVVSTPPSGTNAAVIDNSFGDSTCGSSNNNNTVTVEPAVPVVPAAQEGPNVGIERVLPLVDNTLGVLLSAPLVGRSTDGKCHSMDALDLRREYRILTASLRKATQMASRTGDMDEIPRDINVHLEFATADALRNMLTTGCRALHFAGHGNSQQLYLEDGCAGVHPVAHRNLASLLAAGGTTRIRLAFVSACSSAPVAQAFLDIGVKHVVAVKLAAKIEDEAAIEFTKAFYLAMGAGQAVNDSFHIAKQAVANSPRVRLPTEASEKFQLLPVGADHQEVIFPRYTQRSNHRSNVIRHSVKEVVPAFPLLCPQEIPSVCQGFFARSIDIYQICLKVMRQPMNRESREPEVRILTLTGHQGVGKSNVAYAAARYICERRVFAGGVHVFNLEQLVLPYTTTSNDHHATNKRRRGGTSFGAALDSIEKVLKLTLEGLMTMTVKAEDVRALIVLDGADYFTQDSSCNAAFNILLSGIFAKFPNIKMVITSRSKLTLSKEIPNCLEYCYNVECFSMEDSAKLLIQLSPRVLAIEELRRSSSSASNISSSTSTTREQNEKIRLLVSRHPALNSTGGNPRLISKLALRLNTNKMDEL